MEGEVDGPVPAGRGGLGRHHPRGEAAEDGGELAEPPGTSSMLAPWASMIRSAGPEEPAPVGDAWAGRARCSSPRRRAPPKRRSSQSSRSPRAVKKASGIGRARARTRWSRGCRIRAAASSGVQMVGAMAPVWHRARHPMRPRVLGVRRCRIVHDGAGPAGWDAWSPVKIDTHAVRAGGGRRTTPAASRSSAWTAPSPSRAPTTCSHRWSWPPGPPPSLELATNVAIAFPRNPVQLAHQAYDLQLLSAGAVHPGPRVADPGPGGEALRRLLRPAHRPHARAGRPPCGPSSPRWETGERLDFRGEFSSHTLMPPTVQSRAPPLRHAAHRHRWPRAPDGAPGRRGGRRAAGHAVQHRRSTSAYGPCRPSTRGWPGPAGSGRS